MAEVMGDQAALVKQDGFGVSPRPFCIVERHPLTSASQPIAHFDLPKLDVRGGHHYCIPQPRDGECLSRYLRGSTGFLNRQTS